MYEYRKLKKEFLCSSILDLFIKLLISLAYLLIIFLPFLRITQQDMIFGDYSCIDLTLQHWQRYTDIPDHISGVYLLFTSFAIIFALVFALGCFFSFVNRLIGMIRFDIFCHYLYAEEKRLLKMNQVNHAHNKIPAFVVGVIGGVIIPCVPFLMTLIDLHLESRCRRCRQDHHLQPLRRAHQLLCSGKRFR